MIFAIIAERTKVQFLMRSAIIYSKQADVEHRRRNRQNILDDQGRLINQERIDERDDVCDEVDDEQ